MINFWFKKLPDVAGPKTIHYKMSGTQNTVSSLLPNRGNQCGALRVTLQRSKNFLKWAPLLFRTAGVNIFLATFFSNPGVKKIAEQKKYSPHKKIFKDGSPFKSHPWMVSL